MILKPPEKGVLKIKKRGKIFLKFHTDFMLAKYYIAKEIDNPK